MRDTTVQTASTSPLPTALEFAARALRALAPPRRFARRPAIALAPVEAAFAAATDLLSAWPQSQVLSASHDPQEGVVRVEVALPRGVAADDRVLCTALVKASVRRAIPGIRAVNVEVTDCRSCPAPQCWAAMAYEGGKATKRSAMVE